MNYEPVIGLEGHIQLNTRSKMFCSCSTESFGAEPNTYTCPVCLGLPGTLPVPNKKAIEYTILMGLALHCEIPLVSKFDRKNYYYPDLPKGYQISQYDMPFCKNGWLEANGKRIGINRVHLEEDVGKLIHETDPETGESYTLIDYNRAGIPLVEVVSEPELTTAEQAVAYLKRLQQIVRYLKVSDTDMEKGSMRLEPNVSVRRKGEELPDYHVEIKNLNSFRFVEQAIGYEIKRQKGLLESNKMPRRETRGWDEKQKVTVSQRGKETVHDYRYFPEPDIPPLRLSRDWIEDIKKRIPELPQQKVERFTKQYGLSKHNCLQLTDKLESADYFEAVVKEGLEPGEAANIIINQPELRELAPQALVEKVEKQREGMISNAADLSKVVKIVLPQHPQAVSDYKRGKEEALQFLVGQVMRETKGRAEPQLTKKLLKTLLGKS